MTKPLQKNGLEVYKGLECKSKEKQSAWHQFFFFFFVNWILTVPVWPAGSANSSSTPSALSFGLKKV